MCKSLCLMLKWGVGLPQWNFIYIMIFDWFYFLEFYHLKTKDLNKIFHETGNSDPDIKRKGGGNLSRIRHGLVALLVVWLIGNSLTM